jgi:hypothetical protein
MLEASPGDLELRDGKVGVKGAPGLEHIWAPLTRKQTAELVQISAASVPMSR